MKILIIRPQPGNDASARRAIEAGFTPIQLPFFEVRARPWDAPDPDRFDALLVTSANAIRHAGAGLDAYRSLSVHAVGSNSAQAVREAGLVLATTGSGGIVEALENARVEGHVRLLWLAGEDQTKVEAPSGLSIEMRITYAAELVEFGGEARELVCMADIVALHSTRAAQQFSAFVDAESLDRGAIQLAAFSQGIADAAGKGWKGIAIAGRPEDRALLSAAQALVRVQS